MTDQRVKEFAEVLVEKAARVEKGDNVYILSKSLQSLPLFEEVRRQVIKKGAYPHEHLKYDSQIGAEGSDYDWIKHADMEQLEKMSDAKAAEMERMDAYIRIGGGDNSRELTGLDSEKISKWKSTTKDILGERLGKKWVATRYPTDSMAQSAGMPTEKFRELVFSSVIEVDWEELERKNEEIKQVFDNAEEVRIVGEDTDITMSLRNREGVPDNGRHNIPAGEVFYAPVKDSINGRIKFTYPGVSSGNEVPGIKLVFEKGRIVEYEAEDNQDFLEKMIETDDGSHYIGELGIGTNRQISEYVKDTLFDEKMGGTIHMAIGRAYEKCVPEAEERNESGIHWDIVKDLRPKAGGGKIMVDGEVVQKDGEWVH